MLLCKRDGTADVPPRFGVGGEGRLQARREIKRRYVWLAIPRLNAEDRHGERDATGERQRLPCQVGGYYPAQLAPHVTGSSNI
jgi:hypothetical protein